MLAWPAHSWTLAMSVVGKGVGAGGGAERVGAEAADVAEADPCRGLREVGDAAALGDVLHLQQAQPLPASAYGRGRSRG